MGIKAKCPEAQGYPDGMDRCKLGDVICLLETGYEVCPLYESFKKEENKAMEVQNKEEK